MNQLDEIEKHWENPKHRKYRIRILRDLDWLINRCRELEKALSFYAKEEIYDSNHFRGNNIGLSDVEVDYGYIAREALEISSK